MISDDLSLKVTQNWCGISKFQLYYAIQGLNYILI